MMCLCSTVFLIRVQAPSSPFFSHSLYLVELSQPLLPLGQLILLIITLSSSHQHIPWHDTHKTGHVSFLCWHTTSYHESSEDTRCLSLTSPPMNVATRPLAHLYVCHYDHPSFLRYVVRLYSRLDLYVEDNVASVLLSSLYSCLLTIQESSFFLELKLGEECCCMYFVFSIAIMWLLTNQGVDRITWVME